MVKPQAVVLITVLAGPSSLAAPPVRPFAALSASPCQATM